MNNVCTIAPATEPITLEEAKAQLNIDPDFEDDDDLINSMITTARVWLENRTGQSFIKQTRVQYMDKFPLCGQFEIIRGPILTQGSGITPPIVKYYDSQDAEQTWDSTGYWFDDRSFTPKIVAKYSWPSLGERPSPVSVTYFAGFGDDAAGVPETIKSAMKLIVSNMYNNRVPEVESTKDYARLQMGVERILSFDTRLTHATGY